MVSALSHARLIHLQPASHRFRGCRAFFRCICGTAHAVEKQVQSDNVVRRDVHGIGFLHLDHVHDDTARSRAKRFYLLFSVHDFSSSRWSALDLPEKTRIPLTPQQTSLLIFVASFETIF